MAEVHGRRTSITLGANDISAFTDKCDAKYGADEHDATCYGAEGHEVVPGLKVTGYSIGGKYVNGATGPREYVKSLVGTKVAFEFRPEGIGAGLPEDTGTVHVKEYNQSQPVADIVRWTAELTVSGVMTEGTQV